MTDTGITRSTWSVPVSEHELSDKSTGGTIDQEWRKVRGMRVVLQGTKRTSNLPSWTNDFSMRLNQLIRSGVTEPDWNGHGASPLHPAAVRLAVRVVAALGGDSRPFPRITPTFRGGLQLDWHVGGASIEVDVDPTGSVEVFYEDPIEGKDWDAPLSACEADVRSSIDLLVRRSSSNPEW